MTKTLCFTICTIFFLYFTALSSGGEIQDEDIRIPSPDSYQIISISDGSRMTGRITGIIDDTVEFTSAYGTLTIPRRHIVSISTFPVSRISRSGQWFPDPNKTRLYFAPTGRMLPKGSGYFADYYLFFPSFNYGVTANLSLGGGCSIFPTGNMSDQIYFLTPKVGLKNTDNVHIAVGALILKIPDFDDEESPLLSVIYSTGTLGSPDLSLTCGVGYGMVDTDPADKPMIVLGGEKRLTSRMAFVTENWIIPGVDNALVSYGVRFLSEKFTTDFALLNTVGDDALFPGVPYIDFVINF